jgi:hypothetical protein
MTMRHLPRGLPALVLLVSSALAACNTPSTGNINVTGSPSSSWTASQFFVLAPGQAASLSAAPTDANGNVASIAVSVAVDDARIAQVYTTTSANTFVIVGESVGMTSLRFSGGGDPPQVVAVNVVAQTAP